MAGDSLAHVTEGVVRESVSHATGYGPFMQASTVFILSMAMHHAMAYSI